MAKLLFAGHLNSNLKKNRSTYFLILYLVIQFESKTNQMKTFTNLFLSVILLFISQIATAQVFVNDDASGANDGSSWANAYTDLQEALNNAALNGEIWVAAGVYKPGVGTPSIDNSFTFFQDLKLYGGFAGTETTLADRDITTNLTVLSGDLSGDDTPGNFNSNRTDNVKHIINLTDTISAATVISGFTFSGGNTLDGSGADDDRRGGAILTYGAITLSDCVFKDNYGWFGTVYPRNASSSGTSITNCVFEENGGGNGCGLYFAGTRDFVISNCSFSENNAAQRGAAIYFNNAEGIVSNSSFINNSALSSTGGAIHMRSSVTSLVVLDSCMIIGNSARWGGGVNTYEETSTMRITNSTLQENTSQTRGGAVYMGFKARTEIDNCEFLMNTTMGLGAGISGQNDTTSCQVKNSLFRNNGAVDGDDANGGGIGFFGGLFVDVDACFFEGNDGDFGAAIYVVEDSADVATFTLTNSVIQVNFANAQAALNIGGFDSVIENCLFNNNINSGITGGAGGAISINSGGVMPTDVIIRNSTIVNNSAPIGAGIATFDDDTLTVSLSLQNVLLHNPGGNDYEIEAGSPTVTSTGGNFSSDQTLVDIFGTTDILGADPLFVDEGDLDFHLLEDSPCIDAGIDAGAPLTDLDGNQRVGIVDIGCYEYAMPSLIRNISELGELFIFPNPVEELLNFKLNSSFNGKVELQIVDLKGRVVAKDLINKNESSFLGNKNIAKLPSGIYFLRMSNEDQITSTRFFKK